VAGTAIFLRGETDGVPHALLHNLSHNKVLHERVVFLTVHIREEPYVPERRAGRGGRTGPQLLPAERHYGFKDEADIPDMLRLCACRAWRSR
jgi:KUP system potassium uptake protein